MSTEKKMQSTDASEATLPAAETAPAPVPAPGTSAAPPAPPSPAASTSATLAAANAATTAKDASKIKLLSILHRLHEPLKSTQELNTLEKELRVATSLVKLKDIELKIARLQVVEERNRLTTAEQKQSASGNNSVVAQQEILSAAEVEEREKADQLVNARAEQMAVQSRMKTAKAQEIVEKQQRFQELQRKTAVVQEYARVMADPRRNKFYFCDCGRYALAKWYARAFEERLDWSEYPSEDWFKSEQCGIMRCPVGNVTVDYSDQPEYSLTVVSFKGNQYISNKDLLAEIATEHCPDLIPPTFIIRKGAWVEGFSPVGDSRVADYAGLPWFLKETRSDYATGITIAAHPEACLQEANAESSYVVQPHVKQPMLVENGCKFHLRQYFALHSPAGSKCLQLYVYLEGWLAIAQEKWSCSTASKDESRKTQISRDRSQAWTRWPKYKESWLALSQCTARFVGAAMARLEVPAKNAFELFGADYMLDENMRPFLLEINAGPVVKPTELPMLRGLLQVTMPQGRGRHITEMRDWMSVPIPEAVSTVSSDADSAAGTGSVTAASPLK